MSANFGAFLDDDDRDFGAGGRGVLFQANGSR